MEAPQHTDRNVPVELLYEFRKDFVSYILILASIYVWRLYQARQRGAVYEREDTVAAVNQPRFLVRNRGRIHGIAASEIDRVEAAGNYVLLHVGEHIHPLRDTMKGIETRLGAAFCRIHRSTIVNLNRIDRLLPAAGGDVYVRLHDGTELKCSRALADPLRSRLESVALGTTAPGH